MRSSGKVREIMKSLKELMNKPTKKQCRACPYKQGLVHTLANPCPQCTKAGHKIFLDMFYRKSLLQKHKEP